MTRNPETGGSHCSMCGWEDCSWVHGDACEGRFRKLKAETVRLQKRVDYLVQGAARSNDEICQTLGKALGYPRFKDDQRNFPGASDADGVCVGDHVAESLASEAAAAIDFLRNRLRKIEGSGETRQETPTRAPGPTPPPSDPPNDG